MNENQHKHSRIARKNQNKIHNNQPFYWKRVHHDWRFWVGVALMFVAIFYYIMSEDFAIRPRSQPSQGSENRITP